MQCRFYAFLQLDLQCAFLKALSIRNNWPMGPDTDGRITHLRRENIANYELTMASMCRFVSGARALIYIRRSALSFQIRNHCVCAMGWNLLANIYASSRFRIQSLSSITELLKGWKIFENEQKFTRIPAKRIFISDCSNRRKKFLMEDLSGRPAARGDFFSLVVACLVWFITLLNLKTIVIQQKPLVNITITETLDGRF